MRTFHRTGVTFYARYAMGAPVLVIASECGMSVNAVYAIMREKSKRYEETKKARQDSLESRFNELSGLKGQFDLNGFEDAAKSRTNIEQVTLLKKAWITLVKLRPAELVSREVLMLQNLKKSKFVFDCYKLGFSVNVITYVCGTTECSVYQVLRSNPVMFEQAKVSRTTKMRKSDNESLEKE